MNLGADIEESRALLESSPTDLEQNVERASDEGTSRKMNTKVVIAAVATLALVALAVVAKPEVIAVTDTMPAPTHMKEIDPTVDFSTGEVHTTTAVTNGDTSVLLGGELKRDCENKALVGFNLVTQEKEGEKQVFYNYYCDDSGAPMDSSTKMVTENKIEANSKVGALSAFKVDCGTNVGLNFVLTSLQLDETEAGKYEYNYKCATYEGGMLTCAQFYTDLTSETDDDTTVGTLADHPVQCFEGSALQEFKYERKDNEVRYAFQCCTKANVPTPSPTPLPTEEPTVEPTMEPTAAESNEPVQDSTEAPVVLATLKPTAADTESPTEEPVANPTDRPTKEPTVEKTEKPIDQPTEAPSEPKPLDPVIVESEQLPRYCPFTYLAGTSELEIFDGCVFISMDQLIYMRDEETSPSVYICTSKEDGDVKVTNKDLKRYGLIQLGEGTVSDVRVGKNTQFDVLDKEGNTLFTTTHDDQRLVKERRVNEAKIHSGLLSTTTSAIDVKIPKDCDTSGADNAEAAIEGNEPIV